MSEIKLKTEESKKEAKAQIPETSDKTEAEIKNTSEELTETKTEETKAEIKDTPEEIVKDKDENKMSGKHLITFIGNGVWTDANGVMWHKTNESMQDHQIFSKEEYDARPDIQFMVNYGTMTHTDI